LSATGSVRIDEPQRPDLKVGKGSVMDRSSEGPGSRRPPLATWALLLTLLIAAPATAADGVSRAIDETQRPLNVLLLFASPRLTPAQIAIDEAFRSTLTSRVSAPIYFYTEYLDLTLFRGDEPRPELRALLQQKYRGVKLDLVVALASRALRFAVQNRAALFPGAPVVFASVDRTALGELPLADDVTGIWLNVDWTGTLDAALRLQPETRRVVLIAGTSGTDRVWLDAARRQLGGERYRRHVAIDYVTDLSLDQVLQRVAALSQGTIVLFGAFSRDATGQNLIGAEVVRRVAASSGVPVYGPGETYIGGGIVGGYVVSFHGQGVRAAELAARVLAGDRPRPADGGVNAYEFDWRQLRRWGLDESRLPAGSEVRFRAPSPWDLYKWPVLGGVALVTLQAALIVGLLVNRRQRRRAQQALAERLRFETLVSELSAAFVTLPAREVGGQIGKALAQIVKELRLDRGILAELDDQRDHVFEVTHAWTRDGVRAISGALEKTTFPWIGSRLKAGHVVTVARLGDLPETAETDRRNLVALGTRALVAVPLTIEGVVRGVLAFSSISAEREWSDELVPRLRLLAEIFANALARRRAASAARESEDRFRLLADTAPLMIWMSGPDGRRTYFNRRWLDMTGRRPEEDLANGWIDSVAPDDREAARDAYDQAIDERRSFTIDYRLRRWDGEDRWILDHGVPRIGEDGSFVGYVGSVIDITALNTALQAVLESNALRSAIFGSLYGQVAAIDRDGVIIAVNHSWTRFAEEGADPARGLAVGANCLEIWRTDAAAGDPDAYRALEAVTTVLNGEKEDVRLEYACRSEAGERWFEMAVEPFRRPEGGAVISYIEITRRRNAEEEARRQREDLAHAQRVTTLGELGASLAHEINQPLAAIVTNAQAAIRLLERQGVAHTDVSEALTDIAADARRASAIIQRLRALSRKEHVPQAGLDLNDLIDDVVSLLRHDFLRKQITVLRVFDPVVPTIAGDPIQLQQVMLNLLVNAGEAIAQTDRGRRDVVITTTHRTPGRVEITVRDSGIGAKQSELDRMFERFVSTKPGGLGMGLAISRSIVEAHGGRIRAVANPDRGLTLHVELPCEQTVAWRNGSTAH
jgi:PAS domain S-box-containing protein